MAYSTTNPPFNLVPRVGGGPGNIWGYNSTHAISAVAATGFIANGYALGLKIGDGFLATVVSAGAYVGHSNGRVSDVVTSSAATIVFASSST